MAEEKKLNPETASVDPVTVELLKKAQAEGIETIFDRNLTMKACPIGAEGACCRICAQGPCRVPKPKKAGEESQNPYGSVRRHRRNHHRPEFCPHGGGRHRVPQRPFPGCGPAFQGSGPRQGPGLQIKVCKTEKNRQGLGRGH